MAALGGIHYEGTLDKVGHSLLSSNTWKARYFVLEEAAGSHCWEIKYYEYKGKNKKGVIPLTRATVSRLGNLREFEITTCATPGTPSKVYPLRASKGSEVDEWIAHVQRAIDDSLPDGEDDANANPDGDTNFDEEEFEPMNDEDNELVGRQELTSYRPHPFRFGDRVYITAHDEQSKSGIGVVHCIVSTSYGQCALVKEGDLIRETQADCAFLLVPQHADFTNLSTNVEDNRDKMKHEEVKFSEPLLLQHVSTGNFLCDREISSHAGRYSDRTSFWGTPQPAEIQKENDRAFLVTPDDLVAERSTSIKRYA